MLTLYGKGLLHAVGFKLSELNTMLQYAINSHLSQRKKITLIEIK